LSPKRFLTIIACVLKLRQNRSDSPEFPGKSVSSQWRKQLTQARASALFLRLVDNLLDASILTILQAQKLLGVTYRSVSQNIQKLVKAGILHEAGITPEGRMFVACDILYAVVETALSVDDTFRLEVSCRRSA
jgi:Fic family protein